MGRHTSKANSITDGAISNQPEMFLIHTFLALLTLFKPLCSFTYYHFPPSIIMV